MSSGVPDPEKPSVLELRAEWGSLDEVPVLFSNVFAVQCVKSEFILTFGVTNLPIVTGPITKEEARNLKMTIKPVVRLGVTPERLVELEQCNRN